MENYSVLMSVYKNEIPKYLSQSIESILNQTWKTDDFIIIADGPLTDELNKVLEKYNSQNCIHIFRLKENVGLGCALNIGLKKCKNELVARMDSDDISLKDRCRLQVLEFEKNPKLQLVGSNIEEFNDNPDEIIALKMTPCSKEDIFEFAKRRNPFNHPTVMYKKSYILLNGGYSTLKTGQDFELFNRLVSKNMCCMNIAVPLLKFRRDKYTNARRKNWDSIKTNIQIIVQSYKRGYSKITDVLYIYCTQIALFILPTKIINLIYLKRYRRKIS